jgi:hypothetical protein
MLLQAARLSRANTRTTAAGQVCWQSAYGVGSKSNESKHASVMFCLTVRIAPATEGVVVPMFA